MKNTFGRWLPSRIAPRVPWPEGGRDFNRLTLSFPKDLEDEFRRDYSRKSLRLVRFSTALIAALYGAGGFFDTVADVKAVWVIRYAIVDPFLIFAFLFTFSRHFERFRELVLVIVYLVVAFSFIAVIVLAGPSASQSYYPSLLLGVVYAFVVFRPRFIYTTCASLVVILGYEISAIWLLDTPLPVLMRNNFYLLASITIGMLAGYHIELYSRRDFLQRRQLEFANLAKSRFLAAASHDLRQPLHALGLFVAQLHGGGDAAERNRVVGRIEVAVAAMNELFNALLDIAKLDAGILVANRTEFPITHLLQRIETNFAGPAREKGLRLHVAPSDAWVRSDAILLERILLNLVSNALRYTARGSVLVGCRRRGDVLRIEVWDTGPGIPEDQRRNIFGEFYQLAGAERGRHGGLGLGLAIVDRLCRMLDHPLELDSTVGKGSRFAVRVPAVAAQAKAAAPAPSIMTDALAGKLVVVIDNDSLVLDGMGGLLREWGCVVVTADSDSAALAGLRKERPDLIISDYHLAGAVTGIEVIARLRETFGAEIPAFLISGDTAPERLHEARASGYHLLHKPVQPMALRAMLGQLLKKDGARAYSMGATAAAK